MFRTFYPHEYKNSTYEIDFQYYYNAGYRAVVFDIDNTLVPHDADADDRAIALFKKLREIGYKTCLLSNNKEPRVKRFNEHIGSEYIYKGGKPLSKGYLAAMEKMGTNQETTLFVGDQLFTDVWGAKLVGMHCILVKPMNPKEEIQIVLKRYLEKIVLSSYAKQNNIILIGYMGCGKTTIGKALAKKMGRCMIDTDEYIVNKEGMSIPEIFAQKGEDYFRALETSVLETLCAETKDTIIASGGGLPLREENQVLLKKLGKVFYLKASEETTYERVKGDTNRPLLQVEDPKKKIHEMLEQRMPIYEKAANYTLSTDDKSVEAVVKEIIKNKK